MLEITARLKGASPISFSRPITTPKTTGEKAESYEARTWRERMHTAESGEVFIPPMAMKHCLADVAKFLGETVPGKGKATYTKHYKAGLMVTEPMMLGVKGDEVKSERLFVPSDGKPGGGSRVWKIFPFIPAGWKTVATLIVMDPVLTADPDKIKEHLVHAGKFIGMGRFRPINGGFYGRFAVGDFDVKEMN